MSGSKLRAIGKITEEDAKREMSNHDSSYNGHEVHIQRAYLKGNTLSLFVEFPNERVFAILYEIDRGMWE